MPSRDYEWFMKADKSKYKEGEYVIIVDQRIVAHTKNRLKEVLDRVRKRYANKTPLVAKIPSKETLVL